MRLAAPSFMPMVVLSNKSDLMDRIPDTQKVIDVVNVRAQEYRQYAGNEYCNMKEYNFSKMT
jgi:hypothetical protein